MAAQPSINFISTGRVKIRESMSAQTPTRPKLSRKLRCFVGEWTDWLPIGVFLIRHNDGPILVDTGASPDCIKAGYFSTLNMLIHIVNQLEVSPEDGIVPQLAKIGIHPRDLQAVVLTHLHHDHAGGVGDIFEAAPDVPIYVSSEHWDAFGKHPWYAATQGCTPHHWPKDFGPALLSFDGPSIGPWPKSHPITKDGTIVAVQTPGHVPGHISIVVNAPDLTYLITGDATYALEFLEAEEPDGINDDPMQAFESLRLIKEFARQRDVVVLPNHDVNTPRLLKDKVVYRPKSDSQESKA